MTTDTYIRRSRFAAPAEEVFRWHSRPGAFERLTPPWDHVEVVERTGSLHDGGRVTFRVPVGPFRRRWVSEHFDYQEGRQFRDRQLEGPFAAFEHTHRIEPDGPDACWLEDQVVYTPPLGSFGHLVGSGLIRSRLERTFAYRHRVLADDLAAHRRFPGKKLHVLVSGSHGLVGSTLVPFLTTGGHQITRLTRGRPNPGEDGLAWDPQTGSTDLAALEGIDAVVHLAGESIAGGRWTAERKARIRDSRVQGTRLLCEALARMERPPKVLVCASAIGCYGSRGDEVLTEDSPPGTGFLVEVCRDWEAATAPAAERGIRVVNLRFGVILSPAGGALAKMLPAFRVGAGGVVGSGGQWLSWISVDDAAGAVHHCLLTEPLRGPANAVTPNPVTNREFTKTLGKVLWRPTVAPMPAFAARLAFGEMADELLLASTRVQPARLLETGYLFRHPRLEEALRYLLGAE